MREVITDIVKQTFGIADIIKITGTLTETKIQAVDEKRTIFVEGKLAAPVPEFLGEFGLTNLALLRGLLDFAIYRTDRSTFTVKRRVLNGVDTVEQFEFRDGKGAGADFRCMSPERVPAQADIKNIPWQFEITPTKGKIAEFQQLSTLYAEVDKEKLFGAKIDNGNLLFFFGDGNAATHRASMVFEEGVVGSLNEAYRYNAAQLLQMIKIAGSEARIKISNGGSVLCIEAGTQHGSFSYYLRANR